MGLIRTDSFSAAERLRPTIRLSRTHFAGRLNSGVELALLAQGERTVNKGLAALEQALIRALQPCWDDPASLSRLTAYPWWRATAQAITTSPL
jgi:hypothetical protein